MSQNAPYVLLDDQISHKQRYYTKPIDIIQANDADDVPQALATLKDYHAKGYYLAGYLSYDLGFVFEPKLAALIPAKREGPLLQFGVFESVSTDVPAHYLYTSKQIELSLEPAWSEKDYTSRFEKVMNYIRAGDVYQINLTFPMLGRYAGVAHELYAAYRSRQKGRYGGVASLGSGPEIISLSPELFFNKEGRDMSMRPMKGTRPRADTIEGDRKLREDMRGEDKSQAENLMIVDLLRNDLSRISETGSVEVPELFALETYPTLHQMTSRVTSRLKDGTDFEEIFKSLFPCGSITGAPKIRAMEIISELEENSREAYCGGLGYIDPNGDACFNVSIRTLILGHKKLRYNVGSGLVLDSDPADEYAECLLKADVLKTQDTDLIETFLWSAKSGAQRLERHKNRIQFAAKALNIPFNEKAFFKALNPLKACKADQRVRLTLNDHGAFKLSHTDYHSIERLTFSLSKYALSNDVQTTSYKVSNRNFYDGERDRIKSMSTADEVIFFNQKDELCEGSFTSIFIEKDGQLLTPPLSAGLLPGILRAELIKTGRAAEQTLRMEDLLCANKIYLGNSLRGLIPAKLIDSKPR